jgi:hypothetical protein
VTDRDAGEDLETKKSAEELLVNARDIEPARAQPGTAARETIEAEKAQVDLKLQKIVGYGALFVMIVQLVLADGVFIGYAFATGWGNLPTGAIQAWLGATVIQVVAVVLIIARSLFPHGGRHSD